MHSRSLAWDTADASAQYRQIAGSGETAELAIEKRIVGLKTPACTLSHNDFAYVAVLPERFCGGGSRHQLAMFADGGLMVEGLKSLFQQSPSHETMRPRSDGLCQNAQSPAVLERYSSKGISASAVPKESDMGKQHRGFASMD